MPEQAPHIDPLVRKSDLAEYPKKWEVRFLIIAGLTATQLIPAGEVAKAAISAIPV